MFPTKYETKATIPPNNPSSNADFNLFISAIDPFIQPGNEIDNIVSKVIAIILSSFSVINKLVNIYIRMGNNPNNAKDKKVTIEFLIG